MKKVNFLILLVAACMIVSCNKDEETGPNDISGTWEKSTYHETSDLDFVSRYIFKADGTFILKGVAQAPDSNEDLGYTFRVEGRFSLNGQNYSETLETSFRIPEESEEDYLPLEELVDSGNGTSTLEGGTLIIKNGGELIEIEFPCDDMEPNINYICVGAQEYEKVE